MFEIITTITNFKGLCFVLIENGVILLLEPMKTSIERITWDTDFWNNSFPKLKYFYFTALLPELAQPRLQHGGIRESGEWLQNKDEWNTFLSNLLKL